MSGLTSRIGATQASDFNQVATAHDSPVQPLTSALKRSGDFSTEQARTGLRVTFQNNYSYSSQGDETRSNWELSADSADDDSDRDSNRDSDEAEEDLSVFQYTFDDDKGDDESDSDSVDALQEFQLWVEELEKENDEEESDEAGNFDPQVDCPDYLVSSSRAAALPTPLNSVTTRDKIEAEVKATPRHNTAGGCATKTKEADYDDKILLEMNHKHVEIDVSLFQETFLPGANLTDAQLHKVGDFGELQELLESSPLPAEPEMYPILVCSSAFLPSFDCRSSPASPKW